MGELWTRTKLAFAAFFTILFKGRLRATAERLVVVHTPAARAEDRSDSAVQILALLQRDGRLIDFLMEDLGAYSDAQIGATVRDVHGGCRRVLDRYVTLESILTGREGEPITLAQAIDPAAVRLVGHVTDRPPLHGTLLHRGWRAARVELPALGDPAGRTVIAQAEIEAA